MLRQQVYEGEEEILAATLEGLAHDREKWLRDRQKNDWVEGDALTWIPVCALQVS